MKYEALIRYLAAARTPFSILTKGTLLRRDLPLLAEVARSVPVGIGVSLAVLDDALQQSVEPGTPTARARLELIRAVRAAGLPCGVMVAPVMPYLTDSVGHLDALLGALAAAGATGATVLPMHLKGSVKPLFLRWLAAERPDLVAAYRRLYGPQAHVPAGYKDRLWARVRPLLAAHGFASGADGSPDAAHRPEEGSYPSGSLRFANRDGAPAAPPGGGRRTDPAGPQQLSLF